MLKLATPTELAWMKRTRARSMPCCGPICGSGDSSSSTSSSSSVARQDAVPRRRDLARHVSLWDANTREKLDKDRFRQDLGGVEDAYQEVYRRVVAPR